MKSLARSDYQLTLPLFSLVYAIPVIGHCIEHSNLCLYKASKITPPSQPPENPGPSVQLSDAESARLFAVSREPRKRPLAPGRRASGVDLPTLRRPRSTQSLCHFQLRDVRRSSGQAASADRSAAAGDVRELLRSAIPFPQKACSVGDESGLAQISVVSFPEALPPIFALGKPAPVLGQQGRAFYLHGGRQ